ncbi:MAG: hypothetical protein WCR02_01375 [Sphaerochaetaceae bacterium]
METVLILAVIFCGAIVLSAIEKKAEVRKKKIEATLRMEEMEQGYEPGTYSNFKEKRQKDYPHSKVKHLHHEMEEAAEISQKKTMEREQLKKGINGLEERLNNIETIMSSRQSNKEEKE